jgi:SAM-dependent methyltransferase
MKRSIWLVAQIGPLRQLIVAAYSLQPYLSSGWKRVHPYDRAHPGINTSGVLPGYLIAPGSPLDEQVTAYVAIQPSILRTAISVSIPDPSECHFIDFGCGKGRSLLVAAELGFGAITGVELSPLLSGIARRNVSASGSLRRGQSPIHVLTRNALEYQLPAEQLVIFLYNPFRRDVVSQLLFNIESHLRTAQQSVYIVYINPTAADVFDGSSLLERRFAAQVPYASEELGYGPDQSDAVVVWQNRGNPNPQPVNPDPNASITVLVPGVRAVLKNA